MDEKLTILLCEDDENLGMLLREYLQAKGYSAELCPDGEAGYKAFLKTKFDLCVLDVMMPKKDGFTLAQEIRAANAEIPIIFLTAKTLKEDILEGFKIGADDYITKPFNPLELVARVKSHMRRYTQLGNLSQQSTDTIYRCGGLQINDDTKEVYVDDEQIKLTPIEYNILLLLVKNAGKVFSIDEIYEQIWNEEAIGADNTVAVHIRHIREKIEINPREPRYLKVVWGVGYKIEKQ